MASGVALPFTPARPLSFGFTPLPALYWPYIAATLLGYVLSHKRSKPGSYAAGGSELRDGSSFRQEIAPAAHGARAKAARAAHRAAPGIRPAYATSREAGARRPMVLTTIASIRVRLEQAGKITLWKT